MTDSIVITYQTLSGAMRKREYRPIPGSSNWSLTTYERHNGEWRPEGSTEVKHVQEGEPEA